MHSKFWYLEFFGVWSRCEWCADMCLEIDESIEHGCLRRNNLIRDVSVESIFYKASKKVRSNKKRRKSVVVGF